MLRTTSKLKIQEPEDISEICTLCLSLKDSLYNILEIGSAIEGMSNVWESDEMSRFCFGCKRLISNTSD